MAIPTIDEIRPLVRGIQKTGSGFLCYCPGHDDRKTKSLHVDEQDGKLLLKCFAGCSFERILESLGFSLEKGEKVEREIEALYDYVNEEGILIFQVVRMRPKSFRQRRPDIFEGWIWDLKGVERVLYRLPEVKEAIEKGETLFFVEGEKDVDNLRAAGFKATTSSGGSQGKWLPQYTEALQGASIVIIPDNDEPGKDYGSRVGSLLHGWAKSIKWLELDAKDVSDWLLTHDAETLRNMAAEAPPFVPPNTVSREEFYTLQSHMVYITSRINEHIRFTSPKKRPKSKSEGVSLG